MFRNRLAEEVFIAKGYMKNGCTWEELASMVVNDVCTNIVTKDTISSIKEAISSMRFLPGGRYLYYAGRKAKYYKNCLLLKALEDTKEDWANLSMKTELCLMCGGGVGIDYSIYRPQGSLLGRTGGYASGPLKALEKINGIGRVVQQGGSRRSALYGSLSCDHQDISKWIHVKDKCDGYLDSTNISVNYNTKWLESNPVESEVFLDNVRQALLTGEPGFSFNFYKHEKETLRNAPVSKNTHVLLDTGYVYIKDIIDKEVIIWTGKRWAKTTFKKTSDSSSIVRVGISNSHFIDADENHEFLLEGIKRVKAKDLKLFDKLCTSYTECNASVISLQCIVPMDVYCCDVGYDEHSFMAEGVLISNCTEVISEDDSDVCNLGSLNMSLIDNLDTFIDTIKLATQFLLCGSIVGELPYKKVEYVRSKNRRLGLGLMGIHEWLLKRGYKYEMNPELERWLEAYKKYSTQTALEFCNHKSISVPVATRCIAPTGSLSILASTSSGIEPLYAIAYKRRYMQENKWMYQYVIDSTAKYLMEQGITKIETALDLAEDYERRIKFQYEVQKYVDQGISSTINLPHSSKLYYLDVAKCIVKYCSGLRGLTFYPDGARGGQPLEVVSYEEAKKNEGRIFFSDICDIAHKSTCGG
jgi:ribonucleotide reductase alpha subunit